jgi:DNA primase
LSKISEDILNTIDIVDIINRYVPLKRAGANFTACCPFHNEKTPSFMVSPSKQIFKCFGCGKGGNVITFIQEIERIDFRDAAKELAKQANIDLAKYQIDPKKNDDRQDEKEKIKRIHKLAQKFFIEQLEKHPSAKKYLIEGRKLDEKIIKEFGIGYAPDSHYALIQELKSKGFSDQDLIEASLAKKSQTWWDLYAFFRHRITFPIYDTMNNIVGFSARIVDPNDKPKYINSAEHKAFQKSQLLYGLNRAKSEIKEHNALFIVEGQMDVIWLARLGYHLGVATCGTALTQEHLKLIKRFTEHLFLLFDNDDAGHEASIRALTLSYQNSLFPKIISLPEGFKDIDELANTTDGKERFDEERKKGQDGFSVVFQHMKKKFDLTSPIDKQKILNIMFGLILNINSSAMQDHYVQVLWEKIGIWYEIMRVQYIQFAKNEGKYILQQATRRKEVKYEIDREVLVSALFYQDFINQYRETQDKRIQIIELMNTIIKIVPDTKISQTIKDPWQNEKLVELQLRRDKELADKEEDKRYQAIKQIILPVLQGYIQKITKSTTISSEEKQTILNLTKNI